MWCELLIKSDKMSCCCLCTFWQTLHIICTIYLCFTISVCFGIFCLSPALDMDNDNKDSDLPLARHYKSVWWWCLDCSHLHFILAHRLISVAIHAETLLQSDGCSALIQEVDFSYLQNPVVGFEPGSVGGPFRSNHVDINSFFQEAVWHTEAEIVYLWVFYHGYLQTTARGCDVAT